MPDLGPKKVALFWKQLGVTNLAELEAAARAGKLRCCRGWAKNRRRDPGRHRSAEPAQRPHPAGQGLAFCPVAAGFAARRSRRKGGGSGRQPAPDACDRWRHRPAGCGQRFGGGDAGVCRPSGGDPRARVRARPRPASSSATTCAPSFGCTRRSALARRCSTPPARRTTTCGCASWR